MGDVCQWMARHAPLALSEVWDNTGLLLGDETHEVQRLQTCLTLTDDSVDEALQCNAQMVIVHHPLPFKPLSRLTTGSHTGKLLWRLATHSISVYSPHTAWDSAAGGINAMLADMLQLSAVQPLIPSPKEDYRDWGTGRIGRLARPLALSEIVQKLTQMIPGSRRRGVDAGRPISQVALACGSGGSLLEPAVEAGCDLLVTGEASFHTCLEAQAAKVSLVLMGHFASERFSLEVLAQRLSRDFPAIEAWASQRESDPIQEFQ
ncbi:MAG: Nif3-like dinuclear metal center hexameric protein [Pirellulaceae bacterium]|nr:Nif3-like dinuclear metal center hexameric protein [Pirellulaceae bacterium]